MMSLDRALDILADCHTQDDDDLGFTVHATADSYVHSRNDYIAAWREVRKHLRRQYLDVNERQALAEYHEGLRR